MEWGGKAEWLEGLQSDGIKVAALDRRPKLLPGLDFYLIAYHELRYDKPIGMSVGPIPWSSIDRWATRNGVNDIEDFTVLESHIRSLENAAYQFEEKRKGSK